MTSNSDTNHPDSRLDSSTTESFSQPRPRHDSNALLMLPAPLAVNRIATTASTPSGSDEAYSSEPSSHHRLLGSPISAEPSPDSPYGYAAPQPRHPAPVIGYEGQIRSAGSTPVLRNSVVPNQYPGETQNPFRSSQPQVAGYEESQPMFTDPEDPSPVNRTRGVRLSDHGPVPGPDGVRRVARGRRNSAQQPPQNRYSRGSAYINLPPGAAPPYSSYGSGDN
jgi:chitin synthase